MYIPSSHIRYFILVSLMSCTAVPALLAQTLSESIKKWERALVSRQLDTIRTLFIPNSRVYLDIFNDKPGYYSSEQSVTLIDKFISKYQPDRITHHTLSNETGRGYVTASLNVRREKVVYPVSVSLSFEESKAGWYVTRIIVK